MTTASRSVMSAGWPVLAAAALAAACLAFLPKDTQLAMFASLMLAWLAGAGLLTFRQWLTPDQLRRWAGSLVAIWLLLVAAAVTLHVAGRLSLFAMLTAGLLGLYASTVLGLIGRRQWFWGWMTAVGAIYLLLVVELLAANVTFMRAEGFWAAITAPSVRYAMRLSFLSSTATAALSLLIGIPAGYVLSRRRFAGLTVIDTILDLPIVLPPLVMGVSLLILFQTDIGRWLNLEFPGRLVSQPAGIVLAQFTVACAFGIRTLKATFAQIDPRVEAVARTLGAGRVQAFWRLTLPMAREGILAAAVMTWARAIGEFGPIIIFCGTTQFKTEVLPTSIYLEFQIGRLQAALAVSMLMVAIGMVTLLLFRKLGGIRHV